MTILIDPPTWAARGRLWSHLVSDSSLEELHAFARHCGIPERAFERDHYDVPAESRAALVAAGAVPVRSRDVVAALVGAGLRRRKGDRLGARSAGDPLVRPDRLLPGARVVVVATSGVVAPVRLAAGVAVLRGWGLDVVVDEGSLSVHPRVAHLAGTEAARAQALQAAWTDPRTRAVVVARGGSGAHGVVDLIDWDAMAAAGPRVLVGFSDATALHEAVAQRLGLATVHGPVVTSLGDGSAEDRVALRHLLMVAAPISLTASGQLVPGRAEGVLVGGCLSVLASSLGTWSSRPAAGGIAVLEDVGESPYRVDRALVHLLRAGWFDGVRGIALGSYTDCGDAEQVRAVLAERLVPLGVPVLSGLPVGHGAANRALLLGASAVLDGDAGTLIVDRALR